MTQSLVAHAEFGPLDFLSDLAHHSYVDGFSEKAVSECRAWFVVTRGVGDVMTCRYLLYVQTLALLDLGRYTDAVETASELLETLGGKEEAAWRCKALSIIAHAKVRMDQPSAAISALAEAYSLLSAIEPRGYAYLSARMALAMALRTANLVESSDEVFGTLDGQGEPVLETYIAQEKALLAAHWATVLRLIGRDRDAAAQFRVTAERGLRMQHFARLAQNSSMLARGQVIEAYGMLHLDGPGLAGARARAAAHGFPARPELNETHLLHLVLGTADASAGDFAAARGHMRAVVRDAEDGSRAVWAATGRVALAEVDMLENGESEATQMWREVARDALRSMWAEREARFSALRDRESIRVLTDQADRYVRVMLEDPLTGLGNRRMLSRIVDGPDRPEMVIFVDVDDFKSVNDRFSHAVGDSVLQALAGILRSQSRSADQLLRYGGDEFLVLLRGDLSLASLVAGRIREAVLDYPWSEVAAGLAVTVSIGVAPAGERDLLVSADRALLIAKRLGRNRVVEAD